MNAADRTFDWMNLTLDRRRFDEEARLKNRVEYVDELVSNEQEKQYRSHEHALAGGNQKAVQNNNAGN